MGTGNVLYQNAASVNYMGHHAVELSVDGKTTKEIRQLFGGKGQLETLDMFPILCCYWRPRSRSSIGSFEESKNVKPSLRSAPL